jgi:nucleotide-binding universal stress UspA family protein
MNDEDPRTLLLATDGSEDAAAALQAAVDVSRLTDSALHLLHVFEFAPREYSGLALRLHSPFASSLRGESLLEEQRTLVEEAGGTMAGVHLRTGSPVDEILDASEELEADLLIVGSRGLGGVGELLLGSVSEGLLHNTQCPMLVVRPGEETWPPELVLVADDLSDEAARAGELASRIGGLFEAQGLLAQVYPRTLVSCRKKGPQERRLVEEALLRVERELTLRAEHLAGFLRAQPQIRLLADEGSEGIDGIALTLLDAARDAGKTTLLAVGSRGSGHIRRAGVGSVSAKVVRAHAGPVLVHPGVRGG